MKSNTKGIRPHKNRDGSISYYAYAYENGEQISLGSRDTEAGAIALRYSWHKQKADAGGPAPESLGVLTVRELGELYLHNHGKEWDVDRWRARVVELADFIDWPITQVSQGACRQWIAKMVRTPIAKGRAAGQLPTRGTIHSAICLLRSVFTWACMEDQGYLSDNPMPVHEVTIQKSTKTRPATGRNLFDYLREDEARKLHDAPDDLIGLEAKTKYLVLMFAGPRPGDLWRLEWPEVDWTARTIQFGSRKTEHHGGDSAYTVHMLPLLLEALQKWHLRCGRRTKGLVFPNHEGKPYGRGYDGGWADKRYRQHYRRVAKGGRPARKIKAEEITIQRGHRHLLGITREVPLYALRHTCACQLLLGSKFFTGGRRFTREEIQSHLGHKDSTATERYMRALGIMAGRAIEESRDALAKEKRRPKTKGPRL